MRKIFLFALALFYISIAKAQMNDILYLKNGSVIKGKLTELKPDDYVKFQTSDGNLWIFKYSDIEKFDYGKAPVEFHFDSLKRFSVISDLGFLVGTTQNEMKAPLSFNITADYRVFPNIFMGIATGLEFFQSTYMPIMADVRYMFPQSRFNLYGQGGVTIPIRKKGSFDNYDYNYESGTVLNAGITYTFPVNFRAAFTISAGYRYQKTTSKLINSSDIYYYYNNADYQLINQLNRFVVRFGYTFN